MGILHSFDRLRLQGSLRYLYCAKIFEEYLSQAKRSWQGSSLELASTHGNLFIRSFLDHLGFRCKCSNSLQNSYPAR